jgi:hypothetical protein
MHSNSSQAKCRRIYVSVPTSLLCDSQYVSLHCTDILTIRRATYINENITYVSSSSGHKSHQNHIKKLFPLRECSHNSCAHLHNCSKNNHTLMSDRLTYNPALLRDCSTNSRTLLHNCSPKSCMVLPSPWV